MKCDSRLVLHSLRDFDLYERAQSAIQATWFTKKHGQVYKAIQKCHQEEPQRLIPWKDIKLKLRGTEAFGIIDNLKNKTKGFSKAAGWKNLIRWCEYQMLEDVAEELATSQQKGEDINHGDLIRRLEAIQQVGKKHVSEQDFLHDDVDGWFQEVQDIPIVPFPSQRLTEALGGGMAGGQIITLLAKTDGGKTTFAINTGRHALEIGLHVLHCSFETTRLELNQRYACSLTAHKWWWLEKHKKVLKKAMSKIQKNKGYLRIEDYSRTKASTVDVRVSAERFRRETGYCDLIIVDSGDLVQSTRKYESARDEAKVVWDELRRLGRNMNCPVFVTTQSNRAGAGAVEVELVHIGESWAKATDSDCVIALQTTPNIDRAIAVIVKTKRRGKHDRVELRFDRERCLIR